MNELPSAFLTLPVPGEKTAKTLRKKVRLIALRELLTVSAASLGPRAEASMRRIQAGIQRMVRENATGVLNAIGDPDVHVPLLVLASALRPPEQILPSLVPALLSRLHPIRDGLDDALLWEHPFEMFTASGVGRLSIPNGAKAMLLDRSGLAVEVRDGPRIDLNLPNFTDTVHIERSLPPTQLGDDALNLELSRVDSNPLAMEEAHPDKEGNAINLGGKTEAEWVDSLNQAVDLIKQTLPGWAEELQSTTQRVLPVGFEPEMHLSASYREAPGIVYMTLHPDPLTMAEALIHETQHGKLNLLSWVDPVLHNAYSAWSESPVRPDLRPVMGVLLAVHAFVPVAALHHRLHATGHPLSKTRRFEERRQEVLAGNAGGLRLVEEIGEPTPLGQRVITGLRTLHDHLSQGQDVERWQGTAMPPG